MQLLEPFGVGLKGSNHSSRPNAQSLYLDPADVNDGNDADDDRFSTGNW